MPSEKPARSPVQTLEDIAENVSAIRSFIAGVDFNGFVADRRTLYAVTRALEIISEASRRLPDEIKERHPAIDWRGIAAVGNIYRHAYDGVDNSYVWDVIQNDLGALETAIISELQRLRESRG
jgi:uncharacterized protein with HEPN domain